MGGKTPVYFIHLYNLSTVSMENGTFSSDEDLMSLYVRNVKGIPAGPGEYVDRKPIYLSYLSHEEELVKQLSPEKQKS